MTKPLIEVERKRIFTGSVDTFIAMLKAHGFAQTGQLHENDTYYSRPDVNFMQTVECLRVRERDGFAEMTYDVQAGNIAGNKYKRWRNHEARDKFINRAKQRGNRQTIARKPWHDRTSGGY